MANYNFTMKRKTSSGYDNLYPHSKAEVVELSSLKTIYQNSSNAKTALETLADYEGTAIQVSVTSSGWNQVTGLTNTYRKSFTIPNVTITADMKIDLQQSSNVVNAMLRDGISNLYVATISGEAYIYAIGGTPTSTLELWCTYYKVVTELDTLIGNGISIGGGGGGAGGGWVAQPTSPSDSSLLWIDTSSSGKNVMKFYSGNQWVSVSGAWA